MPEVGNFQLDYLKLQAVDKHQEDATPQARGQRETLGHCIVSLFQNPKQRRRLVPEDSRGAAGDFGS